jgi:hypothetical protein
MERDGASTEILLLTNSPTLCYDRVMNLTMSVPRPTENSGRQPATPCQTVSPVTHRKQKTEISPARHLKRPPATSVPARFLIDIMAIRNTSNSLPCNGNSISNRHKTGAIA